MELCTRNSWTGNVPFSLVPEWSEPFLTKDVSFKVRVVYICLMRSHITFYCQIGCSMRKFVNDLHGQQLFEFAKQPPDGKYESQWNKVINKYERWKKKSKKATDLFRLNNANEKIDQKVVQYWIGKTRPALTDMDITEPNAIKFKLKKVWEMHKCSEATDAIVNAAVNILGYGAVVKLKNHPKQKSFVQFMYDEKTKTSVRTDNYHNNASSDE